jgi:hypothetical protein
MRGGSTNDVNGTQLLTCANGNEADAPHGCGTAASPERCGLLKTILRHCVLDSVRTPAYKSDGPIHAVSCTAPNRLLS